MDSFVSICDENGNPTATDVRVSEIVTLGRYYDVKDSRGIAQMIRRATLRNGDHVWIDDTREVIEQPEIVPNTTGIWALIDWRHDHHSNPANCPTPYKQIPIIAWKIYPKNAYEPPQPVLPEGWDQSQIWLLYPDGAVNRDDGGCNQEYRSIQEWVAADDTRSA